MVQRFLRCELLRQISGPETGKKRVLRGGSWQDREKKISSFMRMSDDPATADICQGYDTYGFRCVKRIPAGK